MRPYRPPHRICYRAGHSGIAAGVRGVEYDSTFVPCTIHTSSSLVCNEEANQRLQKEAHALRDAAVASEAITRRGRADYTTAAEKPTRREKAAIIAAIAKGGRLQVYDTLPAPRRKSTEDSDGVDVDSPAPISAVGWLESPAPCLPQWPPWGPSHAAGANH